MLGLVSLLPRMQLTVTHTHSPVADPECARGGGVSHILAEKGVLASLYIFTNNGGGGGGGVRPMLDPPLLSLYIYIADIDI